MHRPYVNNKNRGFRNSCAIETGLSDFDKMTVSVLNCYFPKAMPKVIFYRGYKNFLMKVLDHLLLTRIET